MAGIRVNMRLHGARETWKQFDELPSKLQRRVLAKALRGSTQRLKQAVLAKVPVRDAEAAKLAGVKPGQLLKAWKKAKVRATKRSRVRMGYAVHPPERQYLGEKHASSKHYYPYAIEYGHPLADPKPYIRPAVNEHAAREVTQIAFEIEHQLMAIAREGAAKG